MTLYNHIKKLLMQDARLRDSDRMLVWTVWYQQGYIKDGKISQRDFMDAESSDTISRARRKVQEDFPELASSPEVQEAKDRIEATRGTFVYRQQTNIRKEISQEEATQAFIKNADAIKAKLGIKYKAT